MSIETNILKNVHTEKKTGAKKYNHTAKNGKDWKEQMKFWVILMDIKILFWKKMNRAEHGTSSRADEIRNKTDD